MRLPAKKEVTTLRCLLAEAKRPLILLGSQATLPPVKPSTLVKALEAIGAPCYLGLLLEAIWAPCYLGLLLEAIGARALPFSRCHGPVKSTIFVPIP